MATRAEGKARRLRAFRHNSYMGHARMMRQQAISIQQSDTTTEESKEIASEIVKLSEKLAISLKTRED